MSNPAVNLRIRACQQAITELLVTQSKYLTFAELFDACDLCDGARLNGTSHDRILDRALQGLRRHGDIHYSRKLGAWIKVDPGLTEKLDVDVH